MISSLSNKKTPLILLPGWGTNSTLFSNLQTPYKPVQIHQLSRSTLDEISHYIQKEKCLKVHLLGFSMGGFLAAQFAATHPHLVESVTLIGVRKNYPDKEISMVKGYLNRSKEAYMNTFYRACFNTETGYLKFKKTLLSQPQPPFKRDYLIEMLTYLGELTLAPELLKKIPHLHFIHGLHDTIAPLSEVEALVNATPHATLEILKEGHIPLSFFKA